MLENRINQMVKEAAERVTRQESSVSGSTPPPSGGDEEPLLGAVGGDPLGAVGGIPPLGGVPLELLEGASMSGESGVFTQTSAESKYV